MSRVMLHLLRDSAPAPEQDVDVYGLEDAARRGKVVHADRDGITVELDTDEFGPRRWHFEYHQMR